MSLHTEVLLFLLPWKMKIYEEKLVSIGLWLPTNPYVWLCYLTSLQGD